MCGRFTLRSSPQAVADALGVPPPRQLELRFNIAPTQIVAAARRVKSGAPRSLDGLRWGLAPSWVDDPEADAKLINARGETLAEKPSFRKAFQARRCLVAADGFYEWKKAGAGKQPFYIRLRDDRPFAFAGLWERWQKGERVVESCAIVTTAPNDLMAPIHDRMPVILRPADYDLWLDPDFQDVARLQPLLAPYPAAEMFAYPVSTLVNSPRNDEPKCLEPATP